MIEPLKKIRIGSRGSPLALAQVEMVRAALAVVAPEVETALVVIKTSGDWSPADGEVPLNVDAGGKGQFAKEIEEALLAGAIDCAVHSMKDMETMLPDGLSIPFMLPREDARDCVLFSESLRGRGDRGQENGDRGGDIFGDFDAALEAFPHGATVGTASVRRQAFLLSRRPDLTVVPLRGNVQTRIDKVRAGQVDATLLALAGLKRLGLEGEADLILEPEYMVPAAGQGAVGVEILSSNLSALAIFSQISCDDTVLRVSAERAALAVLDGSCHTPIGAHATLANKLDNKRMTLTVSVIALDGKKTYRDEMAEDVYSVKDAEDFGAKLATRLKAKIPADILSQKIED